VWQCSSMLRGRAGMFGYPPFTRATQGEERPESDPRKTSPCGHTRKNETQGHSVGQPSTPSLIVDTANMPVISPLRTGFRSIRPIAQDIASSHGAASGVGSEELIRPAPAWSGLFG
jgi:hypothetical protein